MSISKHIVLLGALIVALTLKVGTAEVRDVALETSYSSALLNETPVAFPKKEIVTVITAYSSRPTETDSTPFTTASGSEVRKGIVAANWLPFGTKVKIPEVFGDRIFIVEDRMHQKNSHKIDVWFPTTHEAIKFGVKISRVQVL